MQRTPQFDRKERKVRQEPAAFHEGSGGIPVLGGQTECPLAASTPLAAPVPSAVFVSVAVGSPQ